MNGSSATCEKTAPTWFGVRATALSGYLRTGMPAALRLGGAFLQLLATVMIARALGAGESGEFFFWSSILMSLGQVSTFGQNRLALRQLPRLEGEPEKATRFLATARATVLVLALAMALPVLLYALSAQGEGARPVWWYALLPICLVGVALSTINGEAMTGLRRPVLGICYRHTLTTVLFVAGLLALRPLLTAELALLCFAAAFFVSAIGALVGPGFRGRAPHFLVPSKGEFFSHLKQGAPICLGAIFTSLCYVLPLIILEQTHSPEEVAFLSTTYRLFLLFEILSMAVHSLAMPDLSIALHNGERSRARHVYRASLGKALTILAPPMLGVAIFATPVMKLFGPEFGQEAASLLAVFMGIGILSLCFGPATQLLIMAGKTKLLATIAFARLMVVGLGSLIAIPVWGSTALVFLIGFGIVGEKIACIIAARIPRRIGEEEGGTQ